MTGTSALVLQRRTGSREAVESAIDLAKRDKSITWEEVALSGYHRWEADEDFRNEDDVVPRRAAPRKRALPKGKGA